MIHYHGVDGIEAHRLRVMANRHCIVSFAYPRNLPTIADICSTFCLDNGAYSFWRKGTPTDWQAFYEFVEVWSYHPAFDFALIPDVIDGSEKENDRLIEEWPVPKNGVPVYHIHESLNRLTELVDRFPKIAFGSSGQYSTVGNKKWWQRMATIMNFICDDRGRVPCKIHMLRCLRIAIFTKLPFHSGDSTHVSRSHTLEKDWNGTFKPPRKTTRLGVLCDRIESFQSAPIWTKIPEQQSLF